MVSMRFNKNISAKSKGIFLIICTIIFPLKNALSQQDEMERLLFEEVENINPVYKPVFGFGGGVLNYFGDIKNNYYSPTLGNPGYKIMLTTYLDNKHVLKADFFFMGGKLSGNERSYSDPSKNFNFLTDIYNFGLAVNYDFDHFYKNKDRRIHPFISLGISTVLFRSRTDSIGTYYDPDTGLETNSVYNYWTDGTIRNLPQTASNTEISRIIKRDFKYETPLRQYNWGMGNYSEYAFVIPFDFGFDMQLSDRLMLRIGNSFSYAFSDLIDHVSSKNTSGRIGGKGNDMFNFTYISFHLDLFSSAKTLTIERLFREMEFDPMLFGDEDNDGWMDGWDECPGTPPGVATDSVGCPVDSDRDGIPDYLDKEPFSSEGAYVNSEGVEITEDDLISLLNNSMAVGRNEVELYMSRAAGSQSYRAAGTLSIPDKFINIDINGDGYISFDEMLKEIDRYFDFESSLTADDIYELNSFFFSQ